MKQNEMDKIYYQSQHFDGTHAFRIIQSDPWYRILSNMYIECFWLIAGLRPLYIYTKPRDFAPILKARQSQILLLILKKPLVEKIRKVLSLHDLSIKHKNLNINIFKIQEQINNLINFELTSLERYDKKIEELEIDKLIKDFIKLNKKYK